MLSSPYQEDTQGIKINEEYARQAAHNFSQIRSTKPDGDTKIIALSLTDGTNGEYIEQAYFEELIETLEADNSYRVVLLSNRNDYENDLVNSLNEKFDNKLITINADTSVLPAVLVNIDCLVSCSNTTLAMAEAVDIPTIEICLNLNKALSLIKRTDI
jgi:hypothetical protein